MTFCAFARSGSLPWWLRRLALACVAVVLMGCLYPATELRVVIDTDIDPTVPLDLTVRAFRGGVGGRMIMQHTFQRAVGGDAGPDGGFTFPASFAVIPGDTPRDGVTRIEVEADADGVLLRRVAVVSFTPQRTGVVRIFLAARCAEPATGCATNPCTIRQSCEERGLTCGNEGSCVTVNVTPSTTLDGGFGDVAAPPPCGHGGQGCCTIGEPCGGGLACVAGQCSACPPGSEACCSGGIAMTNGTACASTTDPCRIAGTCTDGVCSGLTDVPDGTQCAAAAGPCDLPSVCMSGTCTSRHAPDGTQCAAQNTALCDAARTCLTGVCQPAGALPNGTTCRAAANACQLAATCSAGTCPANPRRANNYALTATQRCCGGAPTSITTTSNCGVCGLACRASCVARSVNGTHYFCTCSGNAQCSPLSTCRTLTPNANVCACTSNAECPGSATCVNVSFNPNYCD